MATLHFADLNLRNSPKNGQRQPTKVRIRQREYEHDIAIVDLDFEHDGQSAAKFRKGAPVVVTWGYLPGDIEKFFGYVDHSVRIDTNHKTKTLQVFCVGASYRMNQKHRRTWRKVSANTAIKRIAAENKFTAQMTRSSRWHEYLMWLGRSDWAIAVALAKDIGFTLGCRQTTLYFTARAIDSRPGRQPLFRLVRGQAPVRGGVYEIRHKAGSAPFAERRIVQVDGVDDNGKPLQLVNAGDPNDPDKAIFKTFTPEDDEPMPTLRKIQEGKTLLSGLSGTNRFYVIAKAFLSGNPGVRPGMTIQFADVNDETNGYWWVGGVDHIITRDSYRMEVDVGRETVRITTYQAPPTSDAGKPEMYTEPDVETVVEPDPSSEYSPLDDCTPVETLVSSALTEPRAVIDDPFLSDARSAMRQRRPRSRRIVGAPVPVGQALPVARLNGWRAVRSG